jgi:hypothetical protein
MRRRGEEEGGKGTGDSCRTEAESHSVSEDSQQSIVSTSHDAQMSRQESLAETVTNTANGEKGEGDDRSI